jgi:hypothetical protein
MGMRSGWVLVAGRGLGAVDTVILQTTYCRPAADNIMKAG